MQNPPLCTANDYESVLSDAATHISNTNARDYRRHGPRMPYQMWPQKVGDMSNVITEPDRHDTYVRMEDEYYRWVGYGLGWWLVEMKMTRLFN